MKYLILSLCILTGCANKSNSITENNDKHVLPIIDITKEYPIKAVCAQDLADIEYIPLETNDTTLLGGYLPDAVSKHYIIFHNKNGEVFVFNRQGKRLYSFNRRGGSNEEYNSIYAIVLDEENKELYIEDYGVITKIYVYALDGTYKRKFTLPKKYEPAWLLDYNKDFLFCYNQYGMDVSWNLNLDDIKLRDNPYFFISKQSGEIISFDYNIPGRIGNQLKMKQGDRYTMCRANIEPIIQNVPDILITEFTDDTIFSLKDMKLSPVMIKNPSSHKLPSVMMVGVDFFTDRFVFINALEKNFDGNVPKSNYMVYDKKTKDFYQLALLNKDYVTKRSINGPMKGRCALPRNTAINVFRAEDLVKDNNANKLTGDLKKIASNLNEDDNQVLMLIKFNE